jgi:hypothetical protein
MPSETRRTRRAVLGISLGLMLAGCRGEPDSTPIAPDEQGIRELAALYRDFSRKSKRGPKSLKELQGQGQRQGYPNAFEMLKAGELIVRWGTPLSPKGEMPDAVLAYLKAVPEQGGSVLMQDGLTIKTMTADEFNATPKPAGR